MAPARKLKKLKRRGPKRVARPAQPPDEMAAKPHPGDTRKSPPYSNALAETICERIANGETATGICREAGMPTWAALGRWRRDNEAFARRFQIAREQGCEYWADSVVDIADDSSNDFMTLVTRTGPVQVFDREHFERARLRVDTRKWVASKILRHVFGEKSEVDLRTPEGLSIRVEERNALIDSIVKLVSPKGDGETKPSGRAEERRER